MGSAHSEDASRSHEELDNTELLKTLDAVSLVVSGEHVPEQGGVCLEGSHKSEDSDAPMPKEEVAAVCSSSEEGHAQAMGATEGGHDTAAPADASTITEDINGALELKAQRMFARATQMHKFLSHGLMFPMVRPVVSVSNHTPLRVSKRTLASLHLAPTLDSALQKVFVSQAHVVKAVLALTVKTMNLDQDANAADVFSPFGHGVVLALLAYQSELVNAVHAFEMQKASCKVLESRGVVGLNWIDESFRRDRIVFVADLNMEAAQCCMSILQGLSACILDTTVPAMTFDVSGDLDRAGETQTPTISSAYSSLLRVGDAVAESSRILQHESLHVKAGGPIVSMVQDAKLSAACAAGVAAHLLARAVRPCLVSVMRIHVQALTVGLADDAMDASTDIDDMRMFGVSRVFPSPVLLGEHAKGLAVLQSLHTSIRALRSTSRVAMRLAQFGVSTVNMPTTRAGRSVASLCANAVTTLHNLSKFSLASFAFLHAIHSVTNSARSASGGCNKRQLSASLAMLNTVLFDRWWKDHGGFGIAADKLFRSYVYDATNATGVLDADTYRACMRQDADVTEAALLRHFEPECHSEDDDAGMFTFSFGSLNTAEEGSPPLRAPNDALQLIEGGMRSYIERARQILNGMLSRDIFMVPPAADISNPSLLTPVPPPELGGPSAPPVTADPGSETEPVEPAQEPEHKEPPPEKTVAAVHVHQGADSLLEAGGSLDTHSNSEEGGAKEFVSDVGDVDDGDSSSSDEGCDDDFDEYVAPN